VLEEHVKAALLRTRPGKAPGRSGIAAEHVLAGGASTCTTLTRLFQARLDDPTVECIATWDEVVLCLLPKKHKAILQDMRPIALGEVVRNIFVRAVLASILESGRLRFATWQYAYRRGYQCLHVLHRVQTVMVKAAEWGVPVLVARLDVASAFDSIAYDRLAGAMAKAGMSETEVFVILREVLATRAFVRIGRQTSEEPDNLERGGRQGGPETPFLWCLYLQAALEDVVQSWSDPAAPAGVDLEGWLAARGQGIEVGMEARPERTSLLAWADDLFLFAHCQRDMQRMLTDTVAALAHLDLAIRPDKSGCCMENGWNRPLWWSGAKWSLACQSWNACGARCNSMATVAGSKSVPFRRGWRPSKSIVPCLCPGARPSKPVFELGRERCRVP
jgi:hypothetical protein